MSYVLPQVQVFQEFRSLPTATVQNLNTLIMGQQYALFRYAEVDERELVALGAYDPTTDTDYAYPNRPAGSTIDLDYLALYGEDIWLRYFGSVDPHHLHVPANDELNKLRSPSAYIFKTANGYTRTGGLLKDVEAGDKIKYTIGANVGYSTVTALEPDYSAADLEDPASVDAGNQGNASLAVAVAEVGAAPVFTYASAALGGTHDKYFPDLANGVINDTFTITVTEEADLSAPSDGKATVSNGTGTYYRTNVPIEVVANIGYVYIGHNLVVSFAIAAATVMTVGAVYTATVTGNFAKIVAPAVSGTYVGLEDTTYDVEVRRGGVFTRSAKSVAGRINSCDHELSASLADWAGGDVDDEFILTCTTGGLIADAEFSLASQRGDVATGINFGAFDNEILVGASSLGLEMAAGDYETTEFTAGDYFIVVVKAARPSVRVTDQAGIDVQVTSIAYNGVAITLGLNGGELTFAANANTMGAFVTNGGLIEGDLFSVDATASVPTAYRTIVLADELPAGTTTATEVHIELYMYQASAEIPEENHGVSGAFNWTADADEFTAKAAILMQDSRWVNGMGEMPYLPVFRANLFLEYRALLAGYTSTIYSISDISVVESTLGPIDEDNPLALAVYLALQNTGDTTLYFIAIGGTDATAWTAALSKASLTSKVYSLVPVTTDAAIIELLQAHAAAMSTETGKKWRIGFVGREMPVQTTVFNKSTNPGGVDWKATVTDPLAGTNYVKVTMTADAGLVGKLNIGDTVLLGYATDAWGNETYETNSVESVESNTVFYLATPLAAPVVVAQRIEAYHPLSTAEKATAVANISKSYRDRRIYHVFPGNLGMFGTYIGAQYGAAAASGLCSSVVPQQGLTNIQLNGFDDIPVCYSMFSQAQLDEIAEGGTFIIMQETQGGEIYIRHQLSTAASDGNLNTSELSITKNLDSVSYYFTEILRPFIGRYNVTPELIEVIRTNVQNGINYLGSFTSVNLLGPQLLLEGTSIRSIQQHPTLLDRIVVVVDLQLPYPINVIEMHLVV